MPPIPHRKVSPASSLAACLFVAFLLPSAHVPPAWWQGGWRRQHVGSVKEVELLCQLAAVLMPKMPVGELFRSFPSPDGETNLEPTLTAYGVLKGPQAALFVDYDSDLDIDHDLEKALLAYGPPGSQVVHISCTARPSQVLFELSQVLCPKVSEQLLSLQDLTRLETTDFTQIASALRSSTATEELKSKLRAKGFGRGSIERMLKCADLSSKCLEARLDSSIQWLSNMGHSQAQVAAAIATCSPVLGYSTEQNLRRTRWRLLDPGFSYDQAAKAATTSPLLVCSSALQNLEPTVQWLLDLGLSSKSVVDVIRRSPNLLGYSLEWNKQNVQSLLDFGLAFDQCARVMASCPEMLSSELKGMVQWFLELGLKQGQLVRLIVSFPRIFCLSLEKDLKPRVQWFLDLGMNKQQVARAISRCPRLLSYSFEENLKPTVEWFWELGLTKSQVSKVIGTHPNILGLSIEPNLRPKVMWFLELGLTQKQLATAIAACPQILGLSLDMSLKPQVQWFLQLGMTNLQVAKVIATLSEILTFNIERNLKPKVQWLLELGLSHSQVAKVIATCPGILQNNVGRTLKPKVEWFLKMGFTQDQVATMISRFPSILKYSISKNLAHKQVLLQGAFGVDGAAALVLKKPLILGLSYQRLNTRLSILASRKELAKLPSAMFLTDDCFTARFQRKDEIGRGHIPADVQ